jgi:hypothetical protein
MLRRLAFGLLVLAGTVILLGAGAYMSNGAPRVPPVGALGADPEARPWVVKLHARWCPVCMITKDGWDDIASAYRGRVHLVVLDFTNEATTRTAEAEARRLGLHEVFEEYGGATGTVLVLDARTRAVRASVSGGRDLAAYAPAIDAALAAAAAGLQP